MDLSKSILALTRTRTEVYRIHYPVQFYSLHVHVFFGENWLRVKIIIKGLWIHHRTSTPLGLPLVTQRNRPNLINYQQLFEEFPLWFLVDFRRSRIFLMQVAIDTTSSAQNQTAGNGNVVFGRYITTSNANYGSAEMAEFVFFNWKLTEAEIENVYS